MSSRRALAGVLALAVAIAAFADNAVICQDDVPGACAEMPCHTPIVFSPTASPAPVLVPRLTLTSSSIAPPSADAPPPPTPPPMSQA